MTEYDSWELCYGFRRVKVIEKFSNLKTLEIEIENNQKIKSNLEIHIKN